MKEPDINKMAIHYAAILEEIGADLQAEGLRDTPLRAAKALVEMTEMKVNVMHGAFQKDQNLRSEFLARLGGR